MRIGWTQPAVDDLEHICDYTEDHFGITQARHTANAIYDKINALSALPNMGRKGRKTGTREIGISHLPFLIIYCVYEDAIDIVRILHGAQQWP
jgi:toxin ParE1/3/4